MVTYTITVVPEKPDGISDRDFEKTCDELSNDVKRMISCETELSKDKKSVICTGTRGLFGHFDQIKDDLESRLKLAGARLGIKQIAVAINVNEQFMTSLSD